MGLLQRLVEQAHVLAGVVPALLHGARVDPQHRVVADDRHHPVDPLGVAVPGAGVDVGGVVRRQVDDPATLEAATTQALGDLLAALLVVEVLDDGSSAGDLQHDVADARAPRSDRRSARRDRGCRPRSSSPPTASPRCGPLPGTTSGRRLRPVRWERRDRRRPRRAARPRPRARPRRRGRSLVPPDMAAQGTEPPRSRSRHFTPGVARHRPSVGLGARRRTPASATWAWIVATLRRLLPVPGSRRIVPDRRARDRTRRTTAAPSPSEPLHQPRSRERVRCISRPSTLVVAAQQPRQDGRR